MNYSELLQKLFQVNLFGGMKLGLENMLHMDAALHFPSKRFASIHVAGTNGKGSVTKKIAAGLEHSGFKVGLYISPHISCFRERISINGVLIPESRVKDILDELFILTAAEEIPATFFELTTMLAFKYFADEEVNCAVIETGLGGRFDATNILKPTISIITSVSLDHTDILGTTIEEIAYEKAGIIKNKTPVILGPRLPHNLFFEAAKKNKSPCVVVSGDYTDYDDENNAIAKAVLDELKINETSTLEGLKSSLPCRFEIVQNDPLIILDVAHNPDGIKQLLQRLKRHYPNHRLRIVIGMSKTKDTQSCLQLLLNESPTFYLVEAPNGRGLAPQVLQQQLLDLNAPAHTIHIYDSIAKSIEHAKKDIKSNELILVCGSFFIMGSIRQVFGIDEPHDAVDMNERNVNVQTEENHGSND